ncbi:MAG TPA: Ig-like domain-containing protein [Cellulomonas sp.]
MRTTGWALRARGRDGRPRRRATAVTVLAALLVAPLVGLGVLAPTAASAAAADDCSTPTRTVTGSSSGATLDVAAGEVVLLTGTQTGGLGSLPAGATLCVAAGATLRPGYVNSPTGTLYVAPGGTATLPWVAVGAGFTLENAGTTTFGGLNANGYMTVQNEADAELTIGGSFTPTAGDLVNEGTLTLSVGGDLASGVELSNVGTLTSGGSLTVNGPFVNTGTVRVTGDLVVNASGSLNNQCVLVTSGGLTNEADGSTNSGIAAVGGGFTNSGEWQQSGTGALTATDLTDTGSVTGFGRYVFTGSTVMRGFFDGDSAEQPIVVDVPRTETPPFFDVQDRTVTNVVRQDLVLPDPDDYPAPGCADPDAPASADLRVSKSGPASVEEGASISYTITVTQDGPDAAEDVVVTDDLPGSLTDVVVSDGGTVTGTQAVWSLGTVAAGTVVTLTVTGTAPTGTAVPTDGTIVNSVAVTSSTADPDPSAAQDSVTTTIEGPAPGPAPEADPLLVETTAGWPVLHAVTGSSTVPGVDLTYRLSTEPTSGQVLLTERGVFLYLPSAGFSGQDTFTFVVCDNQATPLCSEPATVTVLVHPRAVSDTATTLRGQAVTIPVSANDTANAVPQPDPVALASHGLVSIDASAGTATYQPGANYLGTDQFSYQTCAPDDPTNCATAVVTVTVVPDNHAPLAPTLALETTVGAAIDGSPAVSDPDDDLTTITAVYPASHGTDAVSGSDVAYTPEPGFAGSDSFSYTVCDDGQPMLCSTGQVTVLVDPVAVDDTATTAAGTPVTVDVTANDLGTVADPVLLDAPAHGTVAATDGALAYTPDDGFAGVDTFTYRVCAADGSSACADALVTITVTAAVVPDPADPDDPGDGSDVLATTGATLVGPVGGLAVLLTGAGLLLTLVRRRRQRPAR